MHAAHPLITHFRRLKMIRTSRQRDVARLHLVTTLIKKTVNINLLYPHYFFWLLNITFLPSIFSGTRHFVLRNEDIGKFYRKNTWRAK